ncbi:hypothetical protein C8R34_12247 [Nitrosomonas sp. Nm84]|uniref:pre-toxin TG domain-containing protein n=1 Tax=Nitrosomonas sp. Nm84 TaxID=200124 RepID=UPI000D83AB1C|nr:pre-toxin TG domain-containing protein [Nitrosomonas sp. Nm84]PXW85013.1 hypothetical protein C8R34_12247 [Nitrosomonas sp. Nm84]
MQPRTLNDYRRTLDNQKSLLFRALADGVSSATEIARLRISLTLMEEDLQYRPKETVNIHELRASQESGVDGPFVWQVQAVKRADAQLRKYEPTYAQVLQKEVEYREFVLQKLQILNVKAHTGGTCDVGYFMEERLLPLDPLDRKREKSLVDEVKGQFIRAVQDWMKEHRFDPEFYNRSAVFGVAAVLEERQDIVLAMRLAQSMGTQTTAYKLADPSLAAEVIVEIIECLPFIGNALTLIEVYEGRDLFCRELSPVERAFMGAFVIIPAATKVIKAGRAIYTAARLEHMFGKAKWPKFLAIAERMELQNSPKVKLILKEVGALIKAKKPIPPPLLKDAEKALATLVGKSGAAKVPIYTAAEEALFEALKKLGMAKAVLSEIDQFALKRVADKAITKKGLSIDLAKGQLLEEFNESRIVRMLQQQIGLKALGLEAGKVKPQYFPGHLLTDSSKLRPITDGMVVKHVPSGEIKKIWYGQRTQGEINNIQGVLDILAIYEAKSGKSSARNLRYIRDVTDVDRLALKSVAAKRFEKAKLQATKTGKSFNATLEKIENEVNKEYKMGEFGGQARVDLERLDALEDGTLPSIFVGDLEYLVLLRSGPRTKIFGVLPKDVAKSSEGLARRMQKSLKEGGEGLNFEILGINIAANELAELAKQALQTVASSK